MVKIVRLNVCFTCAAQQQHGRLRALINMHSASKSELRHMTTRIHAKGAQSHLCLDTQVLVPLKLMTWLARRRTNRSWLRLHA